MKTNNYDGESTDNISNNIDSSVDFVYPTDEISENMIQEQAEKSYGEFINRLLAILLPAKDVRLELCALAFSSGFDVGRYFQTDNTITALAKCLGISKSVFLYHINQVSKEFHLHTSHHKKQSDKYKDNNMRKQSKD